MRPLAVIAGLMIVTACGSSARNAALTAPTIDTLPGGMVRVANHGPTAWSDTSGWKLVRERTIIPADNAPGQLGRPTGIVVDSRGRIFVLDAKPASIKVYAADGTFTGTIGREGSGPGEFRSWGALTISRDTLFEHDPGQSRTQAFTTDGAFIRGWTSLCCWQMPMAADDSGRTPVPGMITPDSTSTTVDAGAGYIRYHADGSVADTILLAPQEDARSWRLEDKDNSMSMSVPLFPGRTSTFDRVGHFVWGNQGRYEIVLSRNGLDTLRLFSSTAPTVPIPDSIRQERFDQVVKNNPALQSIAKIGDLPTTYPLWTAVTTDGEGNFWVIRPAGDSDGGVFDVFSPDGVLLGSVPAPFHKLYRSYWTRDRVYLLGDDETTGAPTITIYRIERRTAKQAP